MLNYVGPDTGLGQFNVNVNATHLDEYTEGTANPDGSVSEKDFSGLHTNETFARAFPDWRAVTSVDWSLDRWSANLDEALTIALGFNNLFDEDPPACDDCGGPGVSIVVHDIPGTVAYLRVTYQPN